ncbi:Protein LATERAL ORGAN BOUNDARIES [Senna tora]|uniref:Protein LATERAL ORGAN BOUNDARIES n=1 Tax=Senna tora TaxID=362788 RepID=A0A835CEC0_9FABA|nr:Protein LATERAL ORGAN BOUNDARIES [Senna tora]
MAGCIFAPYFPPEEPQKFANVHKIFGASNVTKLLNDLLPHQREDAVNSLAYEAEARVRDPVYGCVAAISFLQRQVHRLQKELDAANADLLRYASPSIIPMPPPPPHTPYYAHTQPSSLLPYSLPWTDHSSSHHDFHAPPGGGGGGGAPARGSAQFFMYLKQ